MADGIFRMTTEEHIEHLRKFRTKILRLREAGKEVEEQYLRESGRYSLVDYYKNEMVKYGILTCEEDW